jgi:hypothetical protein
MMSGAVWVRDQLEAAGWQVEVADARNDARKFDATYLLPLSV